MKHGVGMRWWIFGLLLFGGVHGPAEAAERRVALIIGNDAYVKINPLHNAGNDARRMEQSLRAAGFETTLQIDAKRRTLYQVIDAFAAQIASSPDTVGLFYYAGHGIQANGNNYLVPVDADIESEADLEAEAVDAGKVLRAMAEAHNRLNIVILDACRNNPLPKGRSLSRGLARMDAPSGTFIAYAAGPGQTAEDGSAGGNGVFTGELVKAIALPGLPIEQVFKKAAAGVRSQTGQRQVPWTEASLQGDFFFHPPGVSNGIPAAPIAAPATPAAVGTDAGAFELAFWNSVKDAKNAAEIKTYLDRYPKGTFAGIAKVKYDELQAAAAASSKPHTQAAASRDALATTAAPPPAAAMIAGSSALPAHPPTGFADELADFGVRPQSTLQFNVGSATPTSIPGGHVITTEALVSLSHSALLIDAWQDRYHPTLPGAIRMWAAGLPGNFHDQVQAGLQQALAMRTNNNPQQRLVFFCAGAQCWESYNAALRALQLGYREVYWYRGGVNAWQAAGLPLSPP
jgi:PQQ-dependent catabolism-associated CXXCW motif protein